MSRFVQSVVTVAFAGVALAVSGCARPGPPSSASTYNAPLVPQTGSVQGVNPHNSEPMPPGMVMQNSGINPPQRFTTDRGGLPVTGSAQGVNPHNAGPMPPGMVMAPPRTTPMQYNPQGVPQTGSAQGVNPHNSEPMPSGMVMPPARSGY